MESREISDAQISASYEWNSNHAAIRGRLNFQESGGKMGSWSAKNNDQNQWLQADLGSKKHVTQLATQGRNAYDQWVTSYKVEYSSHGTSFHCYQEHGTDKVYELTYTCLVRRSVKMLLSLFTGILFKLRKRECFCRWKLPTGSTSKSPKPCYGILTSS